MVNLEGCKASRQCFSVPGEVYTLLHCCSCVFQSPTSFAIMKRGHRGRSRSSASSSGHLHPSPPPRSSGISPSQDSASAQTSSVAEFLDRNKALAEQLNISKFDINTAEIQASKKVKVSVASSQSRRGGLAASVASVVSTEIVDVCPVFSSLESRPGHSASASRVTHTLGPVPSLCASPVASGAP